jgi:magnesium/cobalt transport protein CorA
MLEAVLFGPDEGRRLEDWAGAVAALGDDELLWLDLTDPTDEEVESLGAAFKLSEESRRRFCEPGHGPELVDAGDRYHLTVVAAGWADGRLELSALECAFAEGWIVTAHERPVEVLDEFRDRAGGGGEVGQLDAPSFLAEMLEWVVAGYLRVYEQVEEELEKVDIESMSGRGDPARTLDQLVALRATNGRLRRTLAPHREIFNALTHPEYDLLSSSQSAQRFEVLVTQLDRALDSARDAREAVRGSFDVLIAQSGQRTNEIMKVLTLASVLLLPGALIAGVMGMNFRLGLFEHEWVFWVVIAAMLAIAAATLVLGRLRRWI